MGSSFSTKVRDLTEVSRIANPSSSKLSISMSESDNHSFFQSYPLPGSADGWSMRIFLVLVASSQRDRWSFDSETFSSSGRNKITRSNSPFIECLENMIPENEKHDPTCPLCISGEKQTLKISEKALRINSRISKNRVVDGDLEDDSVSYEKSSGSEGKCPKFGSSSSVRNIFAKPFLKCNFSLGSKKMIRYYYTMEFKGKIVGVKVNTIKTTGPGDAFVSGDLQEIVLEGTRDFDLQKLTCLLFERFPASVIGPKADFVKLELLFVF
ncbi:hypothetical protein GIB67_031648 [Kingdonia uniflora]|uniref:Uncharacterized protein n=1 Tax=Kingdonia uniflora TaxID=39325 RepID=A0A7J7NJU0_9MAGN|nr:hypothetical protein GIB67_031648 [Kingdonia uniflora]